MSEFVNHKLCSVRGFASQPLLKKFAKENKRYYREVEDYDWVEVTDHLKGLEALFHRWRSWETLQLFRCFGQGRVLDAGCGTGLILRHLGEEAVGLDINPRNIRRAEKHAPKAKLILGDLEKIPLPGGSFDTVVCTDVLEHFPHPQKALHEIFRVLVPGGVLIGSIPIKNPIWKLRFLSSTHPGEPYHRLYQEAEIKALVAGYGKIMKLRRGCLRMSCFFVAQK